MKRSQNHALICFGCDLMRATHYSFRITEPNYAPSLTPDSYGNKKHHSLAGVFFIYYFCDSRNAKTF